MEYKHLCLLSAPQIILCVAGLKKDFPPRGLIAEESSFWMGEDSGKKSVVVPNCGILKKFWMSCLRGSQVPPSGI